MNNDTPKAEDFKPLAPHPLLAALPPYLKDPANYVNVKKALDKEFLGKCSKTHYEVIDYATCTSCQERFKGRHQFLKRLGFKNAAQYLLWEKTHQIIRQRMPLDKYNS